MQFTGQVKWFSAQRGYGYITRADGQGDVFAHWTGIVGEGYRSLLDGEAVSFDIEQNDKGLIAKNITPIIESE